MKIAVPAHKDDLDSSPNPRFGRCACFLIIDSETLEHTVVENTAAEQPSGAGIAAAILVTDAGAKAVVAGHLGPKALDTLQARGVLLLQSVAGTVRDQVEAYLDGRLQGLAGPNVDEKFGVGGRGRGMGGGGGRGMGGGRGRGMGGGGRGMGGGGKG